MMGEPEKGITGNADMDTTEEPGKGIAEDGDATEELGKGMAEDGDATEEPGKGIAEGTDAVKEQKKRIAKEILGWALTIVIAVLAAKFINEKIIIKAEVPTGSMENTIMTDDCVLGFQLAYLFSQPKRGDIIIFPWPDNPEVIYVKRIIGLPGETVEIKDGAVYIDGRALREDYLKEEMLGTYGPYEVPEGCYFMLGDNRNPSADSRKWKNTFLKREDIIAKVIFRYSPDFTWYSGTEY